DFPAGASMVVSPDSSTVYIAPLLAGIGSAYNISSGTQIGWFPDVDTDGVGTSISAIDDSGLLAGVNVEGIGFLDVAAIRTGPVGTPFGNAYLTPATGPIQGGTLVSGLPVFG